MHCVRRQGGVSQFCEPLKYNPTLYFGSEVKGLRGAYFGVAKKYIIELNIEFKRQYLICVEIYFTPAPKGNSSFWPKANIGGTGVMDLK